MVPVEFWRWAIAEVRKSFSVIMIAEIYQPYLYKSYVEAGFDYLYDKVGLYNTLENIYRYGQRADTISDVWKGLNGLDDNMLRFMENHDEVRLASRFFMQKPENAFPFVALSALMNRGPFMIYNGQEYGEDAADSDNGRTSIFDYVYMSSMHCTDAIHRVSIFEFYRKLLNFRENHPAIMQGAFYDLMWANPWYNNFDPQYVYAFLRYYGNDKLLIVINFNLHEDRNVTVSIPEDAQKLIGGCNEIYNVELKPGDVRIINV
jgi:glycosidase